MTASSRGDLTICAGTLETCKASEAQSATAIEQMLLIILLNGADCGGLAMKSLRTRSLHGRRIQQPSLCPQRIDSTAQIEGCVFTQVALEYLAIVAHTPDHLDEPIFCQSK